MHVAVPSVLCSVSDKSLFFYPGPLLRSSLLSDPGRRTRRPSIAEAKEAQPVYPPSPPVRSHRTLATLLWICLAAAALAADGLQRLDRTRGRRLGAPRDDTGHGGRQAVDRGPLRALRPVFGGQSLGLDQAPLYYRLTGLAAWPIAALGHDPADACLLAGRTISAVSFLACLVLACRLASADGAPARSGAWAVLIIMASPVVSSFPVTMRPDMLGVFLQTLGLALALRGSRRGEPLSLLGAYAAFGLAICVKQHYLGAMAVGSAVLASAWWRGRLRLGAIAAPHALMLAIVLGYFGLENALTSGMMWRSVFLVPAELKDVTAGSWGQVTLVFLTTAKRSVGLLALAAACGWAFAGRGPGRRIDAVLLAAIALELALMVVLCLGSSGAWYNYALPAVVLGAVLVGRDLSRHLGAESRAWKLAADRPGGDPAARGQRTDGGPCRTGPPRLPCQRQGLARRTARRPAAGRRTLLSRADAALQPAPRPARADPRRVALPGLRGRLCRRAPAGLAAQGLARRLGASGHHG